MVSQIGSTFGDSCYHAHKCMYQTSHLIAQLHKNGSLPIGVRTGSALRTGLWETTISEGSIRGFSTVVSLRGSIGLRREGVDSSKKQGTI